MTATEGSGAGARRRDHPLFVALAGFYTGLAVVILIPTAYVAVLGAVFGRETVASLVPFVLLVLAVPVALAAVPRTRRFGLYMLLGMVLTAVVAVGVAAVVLWFLVRSGG